MPTLLLRLAGPMQSWGTDSKLNMRNTSREPSKSAIIGMIASAFGRSRDEQIDDLTSLKFGVRIDQGGTMMKDFHTAHHPTKDLSYITDRYYLSDAIFLIGLEGCSQQLMQISDALRNPFYPLFLGRRSCPPTGKIVLGVRDLPLLDALVDEPWLASEWYRRRSPPDLYLETVCDSSSLDASVIVRDIPTSFSQDRRTYSFRGMIHNLKGKHIENRESRHTGEVQTTHDVFSQLKVN